MRPTHDKEKSLISELDRNESQREQMQAGQVPSA